MNIDELKDCLDYNPLTGIFKWKRRTSNRVKVGDEAGVTNALGYRVVSVLGEKFYCHRLAWIIHYGETPDCIDHINGDKLDNRIENLRNTTKAGNNKNQHHSRSGLHLGVSEYKTKSGLRFRATITEDGKYKHIGTFNSAEDAAKAYTEYRKERGV